MLIKRTKERSPEITPDNRGVIWGKELNGMATDEELYGQYLSGEELSSDNRGVILGKEERYGH